MAIPSDAAEDAQFLEWERQANYWWARSGEKGIGDEATNALVDKFCEFEDLIWQTPSHGLTAARVKAAFVLRDADDGMNERYVEALRSIVATLQRAAV